jgi:UDP:flavonoid glycosyltransferase YjiC (YdhE family)
LLPFLAAAERRGYETLVIGPPALRQMLEVTGYRFRAGGEPLEKDVRPIRELLPVAPRQEAAVLGNRELFGRLATAAMLPEMEKTCADWAPDLVLREPCEYASVLAAGRLAIPTAQVAISLAEAEAHSIAVAGPALEAHRTGLVAELRASPYLTSFPASLDPSPFQCTVRFRDVQATPGGALPNWWSGSDAPIIYMTFGTVLGHMSIAGGVYRTALKAVEELDARVLLTVGRRLDPSRLGPTPANVHVEAWVERADVLDRADVVVCHGGSGSAFAALAAGVPVVLVPLFADQFENARRIADAGAGVVVGPPPDGDGRRRRVIGEADATRITRGIEAVLRADSYRHQARRLAREIAASPPVDEVLARLMSGEVTAAN